MQVHLTLKSTNRKTGPIPVSTTSEDTCPKSCPFYGKGCYADSGPLRLHWKKVSEGTRGEGYENFLGSIRGLPRDQIWRHNQAGDLPGRGDRINRRLLQRLVRASSGKRGFTYTHKPVEGSSHTARYNRLAISTLNCDDFTINLSANGVKHADRLVKLGIAPVTTVLPTEETRRHFTSPGGNSITVCPATYSGDGLNGQRIDCESCQLCAISTRKSIIGFPAHGTGKQRVNDILRVLL